MSDQTTQPDNSTQGEFRYIASTISSSLFRNNQVMIERDADGNTKSSRGVVLEAVTLPVLNARNSPDRQPCCEKNGFELIHAPLADGTLDLRDHPAVVQHYYAQCEKLVSKITGAQAYAFDHNVRSASGKKSGERVAGGQNVQGPAHLVHGDYTLRSGPERFRQLAQPPAGNDTLKGFLPDQTALIPDEVVRKTMASGKRFAIINVWRNISDDPVVTHPVALCDAQTVEPDELVVFEIHYADRIGENYFSKYSPQHTMYYYPEMTRDEVLLIKQWDSAGPLARSNGRLPDSHEPDAPCTFSFHSAFVDPTVKPGSADRWSIEVRCMVVYED